MDFLHYIISSLHYLISFVGTIQFFIIFFLLMIIYYFLLILVRDQKFINAVKRNQDPKTININDFKEIPLITIIIPAWNEGKLFKECLESITKLTYPKIKVIVNAGGNEETIKNAELFGKKENFLILRQKGGADRPTLGKIKALNECLSHVSEGLIQFIDADAQITDELLLRMAYPIINQGEYVVIGGNRPLNYQENKKFINMYLINRNSQIKTKFSRYSTKRPLAGGANTCLKYEVIKSIKNFSEERIISTDRSMGDDITSKGYKIYKLNNFRARIHVEFPDSIKTYARQTIIWRENNIIESIQNKNLYIFKFLFLWLLSLIILIFPFFFFINSGLFFIGFLIFLFLYFKRLRKLIFYKRTNEKSYIEIKSSFSLYIPFFLILESIIIILIPIHLLIIFRSLKKH